MRFSDFLLVSNPTDLNFIVGYTDDQNIRIDVLDLFAGQIIGGGTPGYLPVFTSATSIDDSVLFQDGSNIVIGGEDSLGYTLAVGGSLLALDGAVIESSTPGSDTFRTVGEEGDSFIIPNDSDESIWTPRRIMHADAILITESATLGQLNTAISTLEDDIDILLDLKVDKTSVGQPNGVASLDSGGKVPLSQIPDSIIGQVQYMGTWNAFTNTPTLNPLVPEERGHYYVVSAAGVFGGVDYQIGDWIISNGVIWEKVDNTDAVTSVFGRIGAILALEGDYQSFYPRLSQTYDNPTWINTLAFTKITGVPAFLLENQTITLSGDVTGSGKTSIASTISNNAVSNEKLRDSVGTSVIGRSASSTGDPADIQATTDGHVLLRSAGNLLFGLISGDSISSIDWSKITGTPTTLSGYGITNAYTKTESDNKFVPYTGASTNVNLGSNNITANSFVKAGGTSSQFLKADGSVDTSQYVPTTRSVNAGTGLTGGGNLSSDITIAFDTTWGDNRYAYRTRQITINGVTFDLSADRTYNVGTVTSVGLSMPSAFTVSNSPITVAGTIAVTGAGNASQYVRGDGTLADFPTSGGGGSSVSYYLNGSVSQGTIGGVVYYEMSKVPIFGAGTDFSTAINGYIASFITNVNDPALLNIPAGNWNFETYLNASSSGGTPSFYIELYKVSYPSGTSTLIASNSTNPELIAFGTTVNPYFSALAVPQTTLLTTDRLAIRIYVDTSGRTITLHTENSNLCQVITTFSTGLTALNGLTAQVQFFQVGTTGTDFNIASATATHTFNLPTASAVNRGALSSADWTTFNNKENAITAGTTLQYFRGDKTFQTLNTAIVPELTNLYYTEARVNANTNVAANTAARHNAVTLGTANGLSLSTQILSLGLASAGVTGALSGTDWSTFNAKQNTITLTTLTSSGASTLIGSTLNVPNYTLAGLGGVPTTRTITINGTSQDLSANRTYSVGTVTSVAALTIGTTGTDITSTVATGTTTPVITLNVPTASAANRGALSAADWIIFNGKQGAITLTTTGSSGASTLVGNTLNIPNYTDAFIGTVTSVSFTLGATGTDLSASVANSTTTPAITLNVPTASATNRGALTAADWSTFNGKQNAITLTTTGSSGAATLVGATLNIPQYQSVITNPVTGTGTAGQVAYWSSASAITGENNLFWDATNNRLDVIGTSYISAGAGIGVTANFINSGPILTSTLTNGGSGYVDATYTDVAVTTISTTSGLSALFTIVVSGGIVTTATLTWGGTAYRVGDTLTVSNTLLGGTGSGLVITVATVDSSELIIADSIGGDITLYRNDTALAANDNIGSIKFEGRDISSKASGIYAKITAGGAGTQGGAYLSFLTSAGSGGALTERLRIASTGTATFSNLGGVGTRMVVADANGLLSTQAITVGTVTSVAALTLGTTGTDLTSTVANGTTTPVITLNVPNASATNRGALTAADWTTFNSKQNALTNPVTGTGVTGQVAYFNGTSTITSEANLFWDATNDRLGIATNTPSVRLQVQDSVNSYVSHFSGLNQTNGVAIGTNASNVALIQGYTRTFSATNNIAMQVDGGNVLIGTATDNGAKLQVSGAGVAFDFTTSNGLIGNINSSAANGGYVTWQTSGTTIADLGTAQQIFAAGGNDTFGINARGARSLILGTNNTARLTINSAGAATFTSSVGVGADLTLSAANPFVYGGSAVGSLGLSNIGGQTYVRVFGATHATTPNITQFVNAGSTSLTISNTGNLALKAAATGSTATHVPVFIADPAATTQSLLTRTLQDFKFDVGSFIAKGVRSNAGDYTITLDSVNDYGLWQNNFSWLSSYYATKIIIEAQTTGNITSTNVADKQLTIGWGISTDTDTNFSGESYCTVNVPLGVGTVDFNVIITGTITITSTSELKMVIQVQIASGNVITQNVMRMANITTAAAMLNNAKNIAFTGKMNVTGTHTWNQRQTYLRLN